MKTTLANLVLALALSGCGSGTANPKMAAPSPGTTSTAEDTSNWTRIDLTTENTKVSFVGTHIAEDPQPRTGTFEVYNGVALLDGSTLKRIRVDIETTSVTTDLPDLTKHLKSADFLNVQEAPTASFSSTKIEPAADGQIQVTGDFSFMNQMKEISFPATMEAADKSIKFDAEITIDRSEFGMNYGLDKVNKEVVLTIHIDA